MTAKKLVGRDDWMRIHGLSESRFKYLRRNGIVPAPSDVGLGGSHWWPLEVCRSWREPPRLAMPNARNRTADGRFIPRGWRAYTLAQHQIWRDWNASVRAAPRLARTRHHFFAGASA